MAQSESSQGDNENQATTSHELTPAPESPERESTILLARGVPYQQSRLKQFGPTVSLSGEEIFRKVTEKSKGWKRILTDKQASINGKRFEVLEHNPSAHFSLQRRLVALEQPRFDPSAYDADFQTQLSILEEQ